MYNTMSCNANFFCRESSHDDEIERDKVNAWDKSECRINLQLSYWAANSLNLIIYSELVVPSYSRASIASSSSLPSVAGIP